VSTHETTCVVCGVKAWCYNTAHALGCGGQHGEGGCKNPPYIEFCSLECALELHRRLTDSIANYHVVSGA
jgi:hypothetical protein